MAAGPRQQKPVNGHKRIATLGPRGPVRLPQKSRRENEQESRHEDMRKRASPGPADVAARRRRQPMATELGGRRREVGFSEERSEDELNEHEEQEEGEEGEEEEEEEEEEAHVKSLEAFMDDSEGTLNLEAVE